LSNVVPYTAAKVECSSFKLFYAIFLDKISFKKEVKEKQTKEIAVVTIFLYFTPGSELWLALISK
jgi:hypothetical protein